MELLRRPCSLFVVKVARGSRASWQSSWCPRVAVGKPQDMFASCPGDASQQACSLSSRFPPAACRLPPVDSFLFMLCNSIVLRLNMMPQLGAYAKLVWAFLDSRMKLLYLLALPSCSAAPCKDSTCGRVDLTACPGSHNYAISCQHAGQLEVAGNAQSEQRSRRAFARLTISVPIMQRLSLSPTPTLALCRFPCLASVQVHFAYK